MSKLLNKKYSKFLLEMGSWLEKKAAEAKEDSAFYAYACNSDTCIKIANYLESLNE